jgi:hypothetical protein
MTDTQTSGASRSTGGASAARCGLRRPSEFVFYLRGVPALGPWTRLLSRLPLVTSWVRPRLRVDEACLVLTWGPWLRRVPLATLVRISMTARGVALGLSDSTKIELVTFGGLSCSTRRHVYQFNELLCAHLVACRGRALARALQHYRRAAALQTRGA